MAEGVRVTHDDDATPHDGEHRCLFEPACPSAPPVACVSVATREQEGKTRRRRRRRKRWEGEGTTAGWGKVFPHASVSRPEE
jgi:hypothetical protein